MKRHVIFILIVTSTFSGLSQSCTIDITKTFFYRYVDNPFVVHFKNDSCKNIIVTTDNGTITSNGSTDSSCSYSVTPEKTIYTTISVYKITLTDSVLLLKEKIRTIQPPLPTAICAGITGQGQLNLPVLKACNGLIAMLINVGIDINFPILTYTVIGLRDSTMLFLEDVNGSKYSEDLQKKFDLLQSNDRVIFTSIIAQFFHEQKVTLNSIEIKIK